MATKRRVAQLIAPKKFEIIEENLKPLGRNEILIRIVSCGLCHSEIPTYLGKSAIVMRDDGSFFEDNDIHYPRVIGHEPVGIIEDFWKDVKSYKIGDYVSGLIKSSFVSHIVVDLNKLFYFIKLPSDVTKNAKYCLIEPLTCISNIIRTAKVLLFHSSHRIKMCVGRYNLKNDRVVGKILLRNAKCPVILHYKITLLY